MTAPKHGSGYCYYNMRAAFMQATTVTTTVMYDERWGKQTCEFIEILSSLSNSAYHRH